MVDSTVLGTRASEDSRTSSCFMISTKTSLSLTRVEWIAHVQMDYFHSGPTTGVPRRAFTRVSLTARSRGRKHLAGC